MALQISFTDRSGIDNTQAYVVINEVQLLPLQKTCYFQATIWHNATTRSKSDATQTKNAVFHIRYQLSPSDFDSYIADAIIKQNDKSLTSQLYTWLKQHEDLTTVPNDEPIRDNHGRNIDWTTATDV